MTIGVLQAIGLIGRKRLLKMGRARRRVWEELIGPHFVTRTVQTLMNVGFFEELRCKGTADAAVFAKTHNLDEKLLTALCDSLLARDYLDKTGTVYSFSPKGRVLVETDLARGWFDLAYGYENVLYNLEPLLRKQVIYGKDIVRYGRAVAIGSGLASQDFYFTFVLKLIQDRNYKRVLDVGCGDAHFLRMLCQRDPAVSGVGIDMTPAAIEAGKEFLAREHLTNRIQLHVCNAMEMHEKSAELEGVDAATSFFVLHELCDGKEKPQALEFLRAFRRTLPGVTFNLIEPIRPSPDEMRRQPGPAVEYFLFHDLSNQVPVGREEWQALFRDAGYTSVEERYIKFARTSIFSIR